MSELIEQLAALRRRFPQLANRRWVDNWDRHGSYGVMWLTPQGTEMTAADWDFAEARFLAYVLGPVDAEGAPLCIVLNAGEDTVEFAFPPWPDCGQWTQLIATAAVSHNECVFKPGAICAAPGRSVLVFGGSQ